MKRQPATSATRSMTPLRVPSTRRTSRMTPAAAPGTSAARVATAVCSTPAAFRVHAGLAVIFRYGVVVLIGLLPSEEKVLIDSLKPRVIGELSPYEEETAQAQLCHDENVEAIQPGGPICLSKFSDE